MFTATVETDKLQRMEVLRLFRHIMIVPEAVMASQEVAPCGVEPPSTMADGLQPSGRPGDTLPRPNEQGGR